jgi:hypothetical protein
MQFGAMTKDTLGHCDICGREAPGLPIIKTFLIEGDPCICEKCFFEKIIGKRFIWKDQMEKHFSKKIKK